MSKSMVDLLIFLVIIGGTVLVCGALLGGIFRLIGKIRALDAVRRRREAIGAVRLYRRVARRVPGDLTAAEYTRAVRYAARKYHLAGCGGELDLQGHDLEYISVLVAEAVGQDRLSRGTLAIAAADRDLAQSEKSERDETA